MSDNIKTIGIGTNDWTPEKGQECSKIYFTPLFLAIYSRGSQHEFSQKDFETKEEMFEFIDRLHDPKPNSLLEWDNDEVIIYFAGEIKYTFSNERWRMVKFDDN